MTTSDEARLSALFEEYSPRVFAYATRHTDPHTAQDVVSDVFLVAWRRIDDLPEAPLPWLLVTARNVMANAVRSDRRRRRLADGAADAERLRGHAPSAEAAAVERAEVLAALDKLSELEREAVLLTAWDGLPARDAAQVAGCSVRAFEVRLSRARKRLERVLSDPSDPFPVLREALA
jgi:RNA polymerase sigma factor (sigma-70 family)